MLRPAATHMATASKVARIQAGSSRSAARTTSAKVRPVPLGFAQALEHAALGGERLQAAAAAAAAGAVVAGDGRVADLAAHGQRALVGAAAQHQRAADAVGDVDQHEVVAVGARAELAERQRAHLLDQAHRRRPDLAQHPGQIDVLRPVQVGRQQHARRRVRRRRRAC